MYRFEAFQAFGRIFCEIKLDNCIYIYIHILSLNNICIYIVMNQAFYVHREHVVLSGKNWKNTDRIHRHILPYL